MASPVRLDGRPDARHRSPRSGTRRPERTRRTAVHPNVLGALAGGLFVAAALWWPRWIDQTMGVTSAPLAGRWDPRIGPGSAAALVIAIGVVAVGPALARTLSWRILMAWAWLAATAWTIALASVDGRHGIEDLFTRTGSYLDDASRVTSWREIFPGFVERIPLSAENNWEIHVSSHPPGALLTFVGFDRVGLDDTFWLGLTFIAIGTTAAVAVCVALRALAGEEWARRATPWLILAPAAIWIGVAPDALFAAVAAWGLALLALATTGQRGAPMYGLAAGLVFGYCLYLSYGLVLLAPLALAVLIAARRWQPVPWVLSGILVIVVSVTAAGFAWWEAYPALVDRYSAGFARYRPYDYWIWANIAAWTCTTGLALWAALPDGIRALRRIDARAGARAVALLAGGAIVSVLVATISGMSKSEVERIWLPFMWWALVVAVLLPARAQRPLLALQVSGALAVQHLVVTPW